MNQQITFSIGLALAIAASANAETAAAKPSAKARKARAVAAAPAVQAYPTLGRLESLSPEFDKLVPPTAKIEKLAEGFRWAEGPVWVPKGQFLLFTDIPNNVVLKWQEGHGVTEFLKPSGFFGANSPAREPGANGLALHNGRLVLCEHGNRRVTELLADLNDPPEKLRASPRRVLAEFWRFRRFNSPNDLVFDRQGALYFTDPPYGLAKGDQDPAKELIVNGVFRVANNRAQLVCGDMTRPNGLGFSPDGKILYVANSDGAKPVWMSFPVNPNGSLGAGKVFFDAAPLAKGRKGGPDGLKLDGQGNLFATGPGGVLVLTPDGRHLGTICTDDATANCAWGDDGSVLYMTVNDKLCRIKTNTKGF